MNTKYYVSQIPPPLTTTVTSEADMPYFIGLTEYIDSQLSLLNSGFTCYATWILHFSLLALLSSWALVEGSGKGELSA